MEVVKDVALITSGRMVFRLVQYSSLCEGTTVLSLGVIDIGNGVPGRVQVECGREDFINGEKQDKDKHKETDNERSSTHHG